MGKNIVGQAREYRELMQDIIAQGLPIYIRNKDRKVIDTYDIQQGEEFRQVWTNDKSAKYCKVRNQIKPYYFVSNYGTVVSLYGLKANLITLVPRSNKYGYLRFVITPMTRTKGSWTTTPEHLVGLTFECEADSTALKNMQKYGVDALREKKKDIPSAVELHHIRGHKGGESEKELMAHHIENCRIDNLLFVSAKIHERLTKFPDDSAGLDTEIKYMMKVKKEVESHHLDDHAFIFWNDGERKSITECNASSIKLNPDQPLLAIVPVSGGYSNEMLKQDLNHVKNVVSKLLSNGTSIDEILNTTFGGGEPEREYRVCLTSQKQVSRRQQNNPEQA